MIVSNPRAARVLSGRSAIITGAGRGLGKAISLRFAAAGARLTIASRTDVELQRVAESCRALGAECTVHVADVSVREQVTELARAAGKVDILVNCAGTHGPIGPMVANDLDEWSYCLSVNLIGTFYACRAVIPAMIDTGRGSIINISGGGATAPRANFSSYAVSKAAVVRLTETVAAELAGSGVRANAIAPGLMNTRLHDSVLVAGERAGEHYRVVRIMRDTGQGATPPEIPAELALFLASDSSDRLSGKVISAVHDSWQAWNTNYIERLASSAWYTMRRLDPLTIRQLGVLP